MIEEAIAIFDWVEVVSTNIQFFDGVIEDVMSQANVFCCLPTTFISIGRQVCAISTVNGAQTISYNCYRTYRKWIITIISELSNVLGFVKLNIKPTAFLFSDFNTNIVVFWTLFAPITDSPPMKILSASWSCWCTAIAPNSFTWKKQLDSNDRH